MAGASGILTIISLILLILFYGLLIHGEIEEQNYRREKRKAEDARQRQLRRNDIVRTNSLYFNEESDDSEDEN